MSEPLANLMIADGASSLWWMPAGERWLDIAGGKHLDIYNTAGYGRPLLRSRTAGAVRFDGFSTYAQGDGATDFLNPHVTERWSLEFWANFDSDTTFRQIYQRGSATNAVNVQTRNTATPGIDVTIVYDSVPYQSRIPGGSIAAGANAHVVITFDTDTILAYVDGASASLSAGALAAVSNSNLLIGDSASSASQYMLGWLGPVAQYQNVALTAAQAAEHYRIATQEHRRGAVLRKRR